MVKRKTKNSGNDKILTVAFVIAILIGFYMVSLVSASFESAEGNITLFKSDSSTNFIKLEREGYITPYWANMSSSVNLEEGGNFYTYDKTPVYLGNDTWSMSCNDTLTGQRGFYYYVIELPNMENWLISEVIINQTTNADSDLRFDVRIISAETLNTFVNGQPVNHILTDNSAGGSSLFMNETIDIDLATSLDIYDNAINGVQNYIVIAQDDISDDGLTGFAWNIEIEIIGQNQATYNIIQQLNLVMGIANTINICVIVFMTDEIDLGGFVNDIPNKKRRS